MPMNSFRGRLYQKHEVACLIYDMDVRKPTYLLSGRDRTFIGRVVLPREDIPGHGWPIRAGSSMPNPSNGDPNPCFTQAWWTIISSVSERDRFRGIA